MLAMTERYVTLTEQGKQKTGRVYVETRTDLIHERADGSLSVEEWNAGRPGRVWILSPQDIRVIEIDRPYEAQNWENEGADQDLIVCLTEAGMEKTGLKPIPGATGPRAIWTKPNWIREIGGQFFVRNRKGQTFVLDRNDIESIVPYIERD